LNLDWAGLWLCPRQQQLSRVAQDDAVERPWHIEDVPAIARAPNVNPAVAGYRHEGAVPRQGEVRSSGPIDPDEQSVIDSIQNCDPAFGEEERDRTHSAGGRDGRTGPERAACGPHAG
jgi:hypothetical protein